MDLYSALLCIAVHPKRFTIMGGVSPQPVCSIHLDDATAATGKRRQCAHHTPMIRLQLFASRQLTDSNDPFRASL